MKVNLTRRSLLKLSTYLLGLVSFDFVLFSHPKARSQQKYELEPQGEFIVYSPREFIPEFSPSVPPDFETPKIVLDLSKSFIEQRFSFEELRGQYIYNTVSHRFSQAVYFLQEAIYEMTGSELQVEFNQGKSDGIILTTLIDNPELGNISIIREALEERQDSNSTHHEAFFIRSSQKRLLIIANTLEGLISAIPTLLETVNYEVLGMGPNWKHVPDYRKGLAFNVDASGRPSFGLRDLFATSAQDRVWGTIPSGTPLQSPDETVDKSYSNWWIGSRLLSRSLPKTAPHQFQTYHREIVDYMVSNNETQGLLTANTQLGEDSERPAAALENQDWLWINRTLENPGQPDRFFRVFLSDGQEWVEQNINALKVSIDLSVEYVRNLIFSKLVDESELHFNKGFNEPYFFPNEPEDGSGNSRLQFLRNKNWYIDFLQQEGIPFGRPWGLHGYRGLDQPFEVWNPDSFSNNLFGFDNWLLYTYDRWIDSLPAERRVTQSGQSKKELIRIRHQSYNYHDVPPNFNIDTRIFITVSRDFLQNRGVGQWENFRTVSEIAQAFQQLLPRSPLALYRLLSAAYVIDYNLDGIVNNWDISPEGIHSEYQGYFQSGFRSFGAEMDFNFGKLGMAYYLISQILWNANLTISEFNGLADRWLQRSYGSGWKYMREYYRFMSREISQCNSAVAWARAIRFIELADREINPELEPQAKVRIDDIKQFWLYYYLVATGKNTITDSDMRTFLWKGQMSYMTAMHMVVRRISEAAGKRRNRLEEVLGPLPSMPARYSREETSAWWRQIRNHWPLIEVNEFAASILTDGTLANSIDLNDLVQPQEFNIPAAIQSPFVFNQPLNNRIRIPNFIVNSHQVGEDIGFKIYWPRINSDRRFIDPQNVTYSIEFWNQEQRRWVPYQDKQTALSVEIEDGRGRSKWYVEVRSPSPQAGVYRYVDLSASNITFWLASLFLAPLNFNALSLRYVGRGSMTFYQILGGRFGGRPQVSYFYIPKGISSLDLETWDDREKIIYFSTERNYEDSSAKSVNISEQRFYSIPLEPEDTGRIVTLDSTEGFAFPCLHSVPQLWARAPRDLLIPRAIAQADELTI